MFSLVFIRNSRPSSTPCRLPNNFDGFDGNSKVVTTDVRAERPLHGEAALTDANSVTYKNMIGLMKDELGGMTAWQPSQ